MAEWILILSPYACSKMLDRATRHYYAAIDALDSGPCRAKHASNVASVRQSATDRLVPPRAWRRAVSCSRRDESRRCVIASDPPSTKHLDPFTNVECQCCCLLQKWYSVASAFFPTCDKFSKVVRQHVWDVVANIIWVLLKIQFSFQWWNNF